MKRCSVALALALFATLAAACGTHNECLEQAGALEKGGPQASARAAQLRQHAQGSRAAELTWQDGTRTQVRFELGETEAKWVDSRRDPDNQTDIGTVCLDRVRLLGAATLRTDDGRLDERFDSLALDETPSGELSAWFERRTKALQGSYVRQSQGGTLTGLNFQIELGAGGFRGAIFENVGDSQTAALGRWDESP